ncbi:MAG TPA: hypothetical protein VKF16_10375 [Candidatus Dormibacteraeota bacterium]|nr:hypothetical protein [Candidatus Dormibacteraeota bacterium]
MPDLSHLWQRFLLASALVVGLAIGAVATIFGYSNLATVSVHWSVFHIDGIPLWTVAVVPLAVVLLAGTLYHWMDGLHHFSEHMRHRRRVHELEAEVTSLRAHLDHVLEMPDHSTSRLPSKPITAEPLKPIQEAEAPTLPEPAAAAPAGSEPPNGAKSAPQRTPRAKRATISLDADAAPASAPVATNGGHESTATESTTGA